MELSIAKKKAFDLLKQENLLQKGWRCEFDDAKNRLGCCKYQEKIISLSRYFVALNSDEVTLDTIRHEIAHALTPHDVSHGEEWKNEARRLGAAPKACADADIVSPTGEFIGTCPNCRQEISKHREPLKMDKTACKPCCDEIAGGKFDRRFVYSWRNEKTNQVFCNGNWEKMDEQSEVLTEIAEAYISEFGATKVIELKEIGKIPEFRFDDYDFRSTPEGVIRALLEVKLFREVKEHRLLKTFWRTQSNDGIVIDVWANSFNGGKYETADKRADVEKLKVGCFYELIVMKNDKGYVRLQSAKLSK